MARYQRIQSAMFAALGGPQLDGGGHGSKTAVSGSQAGRSRVVNVGVDKIEKWIHKVFVALRDGRGVARGNLLAEEKARIRNTSTSMVQDGFGAASQRIALATRWPAVGILRNGPAARAVQSI